MGRYWNPSDPTKFGRMSTDDVKAAGGRLLAPPHNDYGELRSRLTPDETLAFFGDRGTHCYVAELFSPEEHREFADQYLNGYLLRGFFFAMPKTAFPQRAMATA